MADKKGSQDYLKGKQDGIRVFASFLQKAILEASYELEETIDRKEWEKRKQDLMMLSSLYATIFRHEALFFSQLEEGKLLSEPEIRFGKLASGKEQSMNFDELSLKWSKDFIPF